MRFTDAVRQGYTNLWNKAKVRPEREQDAQRVALRILNNRARYEAVQDITGVPWWWIGIVHIRESNGDWDTHLANGDPLSRKTVHVPKGRGPFATWEEGAVDALRYMGLDKIKDWSLPRALFEAERYNGWGYLGKINSPYIWSWTQLYSRGKYIADGRYSANAVDQQPGAAAILKALEELSPGVIATDVSPALQPDDDIKWVQESLNKLGWQLAVDGFDGPDTQMAVMTFQQQRGLAVDGIAGPRTKKALEQALSNQLTIDTGDLDMPWYATIALKLLGNAQVQAIFRKGLTVLGTALLVKVGMDSGAAGTALSQIVDSIGGLFALAYSTYLSAQKASPHIADPVLITDLRAEQTAPQA